MLGLRCYADFSPAVVSRGCSPGTQALTVAAFPVGEHGSRGAGLGSCSFQALDKDSTVVVHGLQCSATSSSRIRD